MLILSLVSALLQVALGSQEARVISDRPTCGNCRLERKKVLTLDRDHATRPSSVAIVGDDILLVPDEGRMEILRFSRRTGAYRGTIGRQGQGPGEFIRPQFLQGLPGDSLFVFDPGTARFSILAPASYQFVRSAALAVSRPSGAVYSPSTRTIWIATAVASASQVGYPLHLFGDNGTWIRSLGTGVPALRWKQHLGFVRHLALGPANTIWSMPRYGPLTIEVYSNNGESVQGLSHRNEWLPATAHAPRLGEPPIAERAPFWIGDRSEFWVTTLIAAKNWRQGLRYEDDPTHGPATPTVGDVGKLFDTVVEVLDLDRGRTTFRTKVDEAVVFALPERLFLVYSEDRAGQPTLTLEQWALRGLP